MEVKRKEIQKVVVVTIRRVSGIKFGRTSSSIGAKIYNLDNVTVKGESSVAKFLVNSFKREPFKEACGCARSQATLPHDKIYGLLGLSDAFAFANWDPPSIDYSCKVTDVYVEWAIFLISMQRKLDLIYCALLEDSDPQLPSWTPDWRKAKYDIFNSLTVLKTAFAHDEQRREGYDPTPSFSKDGRTLSVKGYTLLTIKIDWAFAAPDPSFIACRLPFANPKDSILACFLASWEPNSPLKSMVINGLTQGRKLFIDPEGSKGLLTETAAAGDLICVLGNAEIPFILRPVADGFVLVGEAYMQLDHRQTNRHFKVQTFKIR